MANNSQRVITASMLYIGVLVMVTSGFIVQFRSTIRKLSGTHTSSNTGVQSDAVTQGQSFFREQTTTTSGSTGGNTA